VENSENLFFLLYDSTLPVSMADELCSFAKVDRVPTPPGRWYDMTFTLPRS